MRSEADLSWYTALSRERGVLPRCPFAAISRCPRYFDSAALAKHVGAVGLPADIEQKYAAQWHASEFWNQSPETQTAVSGGEHSKALSRFCPEFVFDVFGVFAEGLVPYFDSEEKELALRRLETRTGAVSPNWLFRWSSIEERHFTDCPYYSMLSTQVARSPVVAPAKEEELVAAKPGVFGFSLNLKVVITRFCRWWLKKNG